MYRSAKTPNLAMAEEEVGPLHFGRGGILSYVTSCVFV